MILNEQIKGHEIFGGPEGIEMISGTPYCWKTDTVAVGNFHPVGLALPEQSFHLSVSLFLLPHYDYYNYYTCNSHPHQ